MMQRVSTSEEKCSRNNLKNTPPHPAPHPPPKKKNSKLTTTIALSRNDTAAAQKVVVLIEEGEHLLQLLDLLLNETICHLHVQSPPFLSSRLSPVGGAVWV